MKWYGVSFENTFIAYRKPNGRKTEKGTFHENVYYRKSFFISVEVLGSRAGRKSCKHSRNLISVFSLVSEGRPAVPAPFPTGPALTPIKTYCPVRTVKDTDHTLHSTDTRHLSTNNK